MSQPNQTKKKSGRSKEGYLTLKEKCYVCGRLAVGYIQPAATATATYESTPMQPACAEHGSFTRPAMDHQFISQRQGLKVTCGKHVVTTIHWGDLAALQAKPKSSIGTRTIPLAGLDERL